MSTVGDILSTVGVFSFVGGYHEYLGEAIVSTVGVQYRGGYHEYCGGCSVLLGEKSFVI